VIYVTSSPSKIHTKGVSQLHFLSDDTFISGGNDGVIAPWRITQSEATITTTKPEAASSDGGAKKGRRQKSGKNKTAAQKSQPETRVTVITVIEPLAQVQHGDAINWISILGLNNEDNLVDGGALPEVTKSETSKDDANSHSVAEVDNRSSEPVTKEKRIVLAVADSSCDISLYEIDV